jgi:ATP/maltotriose-dependent transcriptional regulator MalT
MSIINRFISKFIKVLRKNQAKIDHPAPAVFEYPIIEDRKPATLNIYEDPVVYNTKLGDIPFYLIWVSLSIREREVAKLICKGHSNNEIATELKIANSTVKSHVGQVLTKFHLTSRKKLKDALFGMELDQM